MKKVQIRRGVFETNSSSTHTMVIMDHDDFTKWFHGDMYWNPETGVFSTPEEAAELRKTYSEKYKYFDGFGRYDDVPITYHEWVGDQGDYLDSFSETHTTKSGDIVKIFGYYGHD